MEEEVKVEEVEEVGVEAIPAVTNGTAFLCVQAGATPTPLLGSSESLGSLASLGSLSERGGKACSRRLLNPTGRFATGYQPLCVTVPVGLLVLMMAGSWSTYAVRGCPSRANHFLPTRVRRHCPVSPLNTRAGFLPAVVIT